MTEQSVSLPLTGMSCANCAANIERSLSKLEGVRQAQVNFAAEQATVAFDSARHTVAELVAQVEKGGYGVPLARVELPITSRMYNCITSFPSRCPVLVTVTFADTLPFMGISVALRLISPYLKVV